MMFIIRLLVIILTYLIISITAHNKSKQLSDVIIKHEKANHFLKIKRQIQDEFDFDIYNFIDKPSYYRVFASRPSSWSGNYWNYRCTELRFLRNYPGAWFGVPRTTNNERKNVLNDIGEFYKHYRSECLYEGCSFQELAKAAVYWGKHNDWWDNNEDLTLLMRYHWCYRRQDPLRNCPNPCNSVPCRKVNNSFIMSCTAFRDDKLVIHINDKYDEQFKEMFKINYRCSCKGQTIWDQNNRNCINDRNFCARGQNICNYGRCVLINDDEYKCKLERKKTFKKMQNLNFIFMFIKVSVIEVSLVNYVKYHLIHVNKLAIINMT